MIEAESVPELVGKNRVDIDAARGVVRYKLEVAFGPARVVREIQDERTARFFGVGDLTGCSVGKRPLGLGVDPYYESRCLRTMQRDNLGRQQHH